MAKPMPSAKPPPAPGPVPANASSRVPSGSSSPIVPSLVAEAPEHGRRHADELPGGVDQRAAGIARVDRRVDLHEILPRAAAGDPPPGRADDALGDRLTDPERVADGEHDVADPERRGVVETDRREPPLGDAGRLDAHDGEIGLPIAPDQVAGVQRAVPEHDVDGVGVLDQVEVGQHDAVGIDDDARALAQSGPGAAAVRAAGDALVEPRVEADDGGGRPRMMPSW